MEEQWKECVVKDYRPEIFRANHDEATAEHLGIAKTIAGVAQQYYWPGMFQEIARYIQTCETACDIKSHRYAETL